MSEPNLMPFQNMPFNGDEYVCEEFLKLKKEFNINVVVETGSCLYSTTEWLSQNFERVFTVEINPEFSKHGLHKVSGRLNVTASINDSVDFIHKLKDLLYLNDKVIFFLDAHWGENCPLLAELEAIGNLLVKQPPIIVIHDFYTGNPDFGWDEYNGQRFEYEWIKPSIQNLQKSFKCEYGHYFNHEAIGAKRGLIYIIPEVGWDI